MCNRRRRSFVLIEVLVATFLFVLLLTAIFSIFWRTAKVNQSIGHLRQVNERLLLTQNRLQNVFGCSIFQKSYRPYFFLEKTKFSQGPSLVFTFENEIQTHYAFSNVVLGKLFIEDNKLILAIFPHPKKPKGPPKEMRKEVLLDGIRNISFEFFLAPLSQEETQDGKQKEEEDEKSKKPPRGRWVSDWLKEYDARPTLIKIVVTKENRESYDFYFFIPNEVKPILYSKR